MSLEPVRTKASECLLYLIEVGLADSVHRQQPDKVSCALLPTAHDVIHGGHEGGQGVGQRSSEEDIVGGPALYGLKTTWWATLDLARRTLQTR